MAANESELEKQVRPTCKSMTVSDFIEFVYRNGVVGNPPDQLDPSLDIMIINRYVPPLVHVMVFHYILFVRANQHP